MGCVNAELSVLLTDDSEIFSLNKKYRNKAKATDVLSFPLGIATDNKLYLGDIVISLETAWMQSKKFKQTPEEELIRLLVHGVLHLLGYEHEKVSEKVAKKMFKKQNQLINFLNS